MTKFITQPWLSKDEYNNTYSLSGKFNAAETVDETVSFEEWEKIARTRLTLTWPVNEFKDGGVKANEIIIQEDSDTSSTSDKVLAKESQELVKMALASLIWARSYGWRPQFDIKNPININNGPINQKMEAFEYENDLSDLPPITVMLMRQAMIEEQLKSNDFKVFIASEDYTLLTVFHKTLFNVFENGSLSQLETANKDSIVDAINWLNDRVGKLENVLSLETYNISLSDQYEEQLEESFNQSELNKEHKKFYLDQKDFNTLQEGNIKDLAGKTNKHDLTLINHEKRITDIEENGGGGNGGASQDDQLTITTEDLITAGLNNQKLVNEANITKLETLKTEVETINTKLLTQAEFNTQIQATIADHETRISKLEGTSLISLDFSLGNMRGPDITQTFSNVFTPPVKNNDNKFIRQAFIQGYIEGTSEKEYIPVPSSKLNGTPFNVNGTDFTNQTFFLAMRLTRTNQDLTVSIGNFDAPLFVVESFVAIYETDATTDIKTASGPTNDSDVITTSTTPLLITKPNQKLVNEAIEIKLTEQDERLTALEAPVNPSDIPVGTILTKDQFYTHINLPYGAEFYMKNETDYIAFSNTTNQVAFTKNRNEAAIIVVDNLNNQLSFKITNGAGSYVSPFYIVPTSGSPIAITGAAKQVFSKVVSQTIRSFSFEVNTGSVYWGSWGKNNNLMDATGIPREFTAESSTSTSSGGDSSDASVAITSTLPILNTFDNQKQVNEAIETILLPRVLDTYLKSETNSISEIDAKLQSNSDSDRAYTDQRFQSALKFMGEVQTLSELPDPTLHANEIYKVVDINQLYISNGTTWTLFTSNEMPASSVIFSDTENLEQKYIKVIDKFSEIDNTIAGLNKEQIGYKNVVNFWEQQQQFGNGNHFGTSIVANPWDLSKHIKFFGDFVGFSYTQNSLNFLVKQNDKISFYTDNYGIGATLKATIGENGSKEIITQEKLDEALAGGSLAKEFYNHIGLAFGSTFKIKTKNGLYFGNQSNNSFLKSNATNHATWRVEDNNGFLKFICTNPSGGYISPYEITEITEQYGVSIGNSNSNPTTSFKKFANKQFKITILNHSLAVNGFVKIDSGTLYGNWLPEDATENQILIAEGV